MSRLSDQFDYMDLDDFEELLADKPHDEKSELIGGRVVKRMTGAPWEHHFVVQNITRNLGNQIVANGSGCRVLAETFRLMEAASDSLMLPDVMVRCGPMAPGAAALSDPIVLMEIMSDGSVGRDRVEKWRVYQRLPTLRHDVLIERDKALIEVFDRSGEAWFTQRLVEGLDAGLDLPALNLSIPLAEIYRDVPTASS